MGKGGANRWTTSNEAKNKTPLTIPMMQTRPPFFAAASAVATLDSNPQQSRQASGRPLLLPGWPTTCRAASLGERPITLTVAPAPSFFVIFAGGWRGNGKKKNEGGQQCFHMAGLTRNTVGKRHHVLLRATRTSRDLAGFSSFFARCFRCSMHPKLKHKNRASMGAVLAGYCPGRRVSEERQLLQNATKKKKKPPCCCCDKAVDTTKMSLLPRWRNRQVKRNPQADDGIESRVFSRTDFDKKI